MGVYTVSCHGGQLKARRKAGAHTHPLLIPQFLSSRLQPSIPSLVFISASVMRTKESTHSFSPSFPSFLPPPFYFSRSLQARLAGLISNCDLTAWWKDWHTHTNTHRSMYTHICIQTYVAKRRTRASFSGSNYPLSKAQRQPRGWRGGGSFAFSNVSHRSQDTHMHLKKCV